MALNTQNSLPNPTKAKTIGLSDILREDGYSYSTLLTVLSSQTYKIEDGTFSIYYKETAGVNPIVVHVFITIGTKRLPVFIDNVAANGSGEQLINLKDVITTGITLTTGDTVKIEFVYTGLDAGTGTGSGKIYSTLLINDYQV